MYQDHVFHVKPNSLICVSVSFFSFFPLMSYFYAVLHLFWFNLSVQFCRTVMSDSLWHHGLQHSRLPSPSPIPKACWNSCPLSWWCHPTISPSLIPFSFCLQFFQGLFQWVSSSHQVAKTSSYYLYILYCILHSQIFIIRAQQWHHIHCFTYRFTQCFLLEGA